MKIIRKVLSCLGGLALLLFAFYGLSTFVYAEQVRTVEFSSNPTFGTEAGNYQVELKISPEIPSPDPGFIDPSQVKLGVYRVPKGQTFDQSQRSQYAKLFEKSYSGDGTDTTFQLGDYVPKSALPQPGDTLVAYLDVYAFDMTTYSETIKESVFSQPYSLPGEAEPGVNPTEPEVGRLIVKFQTQGGEPLQGGDFEIIQLTGTGTKQTLEQMPYGKYIVRLSLVPEGYAPIEPRQYTVDINKANPQAEVVFAFNRENLEGDPEKEKAIPYANLTPILAPDHPSFFIRIEDPEVHPVKGLTVTLIDPKGGRHPVLDAKLNRSDETPYKILALPMALFRDLGLGAFKVELKQAGYQTTLVPLTLAPRTQIPVVNETDDGFVFVSDHKMTVKTEPEVRLEITFLMDPRSEENLLSIDASHIQETSSGHYVIDFTHLADQLANHKIVKVVAIKAGKAPSEIVEVSLKQMRPDSPVRSQPGPTESAFEGVNKPDFSLKPDTVRRPKGEAAYYVIRAKTDSNPVQETSQILNGDSLPQTGEQASPSALTPLLLALGLLGLQLNRLRQKT